MRSSEESGERRAEGGALKDIARAALVTVLFLAMLEGLLLLAGIRFEGSFYRPDRELGYALRPNAHGWNVNENLNYFRVNSDGLADSEHSPQRPANVIRIAIVGDSVSEAKQVRRDQAYWAVMERVLNSRLDGGRRVEVINFGVAGYSLAQEALVLGSGRLWKYDPQIILLSGTIESFLLRSTRQFSPNTPAEHVPFYIPGNGRLEPDAETRRQRAAFNANRLNEWFGDLMNASRLLALCNDGVKKSSQEIKALARKQAPANAYQESDAFLGPATPDLRTAWETSEALILWSNEEARQHHAELWLFTLDMPEQVDPDPKVTAAFDHSLGITDPFISDRLLAEFAAREGVPHGTLAPELQAFAEKNKIVLHGFPGTPRNAGHWNAAGHRAAGELIARQLLSVRNFGLGSFPP
jgi:hypothetical protein